MMTFWYFTVSLPYNSILAYLASWRFKILFEFIDYRPLYLIVESGGSEVK